MSGFGDYYNETRLHPFALVSALLLAVMLLFLPRRYATLPLLLLACFVSPAQRIVILGADFDFMRLMVVFGWARLLLRKEFVNYIWCALDILVIAWFVSGSVVMVLQSGSMVVLVNRLGWAFDGIGMYFLLRCLVRTWSDIERVGWILAVLSVPVAAAFFVESLTGRNVFGVLGGVPVITVVREGRLRCQGAFAHPILAGCFWAAVLPLLPPLWCEGRKWLVVCSFFSILVVIVTCASSTPVLALGFVILGMTFYPLRSHLRFIRWTLATCTFLLHMLMAQPVWHLIARVNAVGGSTGWHRFKIMDATIANIDKWAILGEPDPMSWGVWEMRDITNQYVLEALRGGLVTLVIFISTIVVAFSLVGRTLRFYERVPQKRRWSWAVGVTLFVHTAVFFGVSYFGQIMFLVYLSLAMAGSMYVLTGLERSDQSFDDTVAVPDLNGCTE